MRILTSLTLGLCLLTLSLRTVAATAPVSLTADQAHRELALLKRALVTLHPGLYRYQSPSALDAQFAQADAEVANGTDSLGMYLIASRLAASVRCGHTWTNPLNQSQAVQDALSALPALPVHLRLVEGRLLITASADPVLRVGDEVLEVDGHNPGELVAAWLPYLRADGSSDGKRLSQIDNNFDGGAADKLLPLLFPPKAGRYALVLDRPGVGRLSRTVVGMSITEREQRLMALGSPNEDRDWRLDLHGQVAILTIPTFAYWRDEFDWRGFLATSFAKLHSSHVRGLILDLRANEGGDEQIADELLSYVLHAPYTEPASRMESAYERVPYDLARDLDTWDFSFFDRTGQVRRGPGRNFVLKQQPKPTRIEPAAGAFTGQVAVLVGPRMSSSGFLIARDLQRSHAARLIGQPTGGSLQGLNGGELAWLTLPRSGVSVDIPLVSGFATDSEPDHGIEPDEKVRTTLEDIRAGRDPDRDAALRWLKASRR